MKKRLLSTMFALVVCLTCALSLFGCAEENSGGDIGKVYDAIENTYNYDGAYTFEAGWDMGAGKTTQTITLDPLTGRYYEQIKDKNDVITDQTKKFVSNDGYTYALNNSASGNKWTKTPEYNNDIRDVRLIDIISEYKPFFKQIPPAGYSVDKLNSAYKKVANISEQATEQKYLSKGITMDADYNVKVSVSKNGGSNILTATYKLTEELEQAKTEYSMVCKVYESNGYMSSYSLMYNVVITDKETDKQSTTNISCDMSFNYSFDENAYDLLPSTPDGNVSQSVFDEYRMRKNIVVNGKNFGSYEARGNEHVSTMKQFIKDFLRTINSESDGEFDMAIYFDSALTNQVNVNNITKEEFVNTDTFYITLSLNNDFALEYNRALENKVKVNVWDSSVCDEYKIIFGDLLNTNEEYGMRLIGNTAQKQTLSQSSNKKYYMNGELFTEKYFYTTDGQVYTLRVETIYTEADVNLMSLLAL